jgi:hypothetical protein
MPTTVPTFKVTKDPSEVLDYNIDYSKVFNIVPADAISTSSWAVTSAATDISIDSSSHDGVIATAWLSGGTPGRRYWVTNTVGTTGGRTYERTIEVSIQNK